ncbi:MAG: hypothetical protein FWB76_02715 [Oscillospiraceae bacterium]|nr:hypothetical protein [Oscillospiraceae bacterium]
MKKLLSVLLALALVASLGVVSAVPAQANADCLCDTWHLPGGCPNPQSPNHSTWLRRWLFDLLCNWLGRGFCPTELPTQPPPPPPCDGTLAPCNELPALLDGAWALPLAAGSARITSQAQLIAALTSGLPPMLLPMIMEMVNENFPEQWFDTNFIAVQPFTFPNPGAFAAAVQATYSCVCRAQLHVHVNVEVVNTGGIILPVVGGSVGVALCRTLYGSELAISAQMA